MVVKTGGGGGNGVLALGEDDFVDSEVLALVQVGHDLDSAVGGGLFGGQPGVVGLAECEGVLGVLVEAIGEGLGAADAEDVVAVEVVAHDVTHVVDHVLHERVVRFGAEEGLIHGVAAVVAVGGLSVAFLVVGSGDELVGVEVDDSGGREGNNTGDVDIDVDAAVHVEDAVAEEVGLEGAVDDTSEGVADASVEVAIQEPGYVVIVVQRVPEVGVFLDPSVTDGVSVLGQMFRFTSLMDPLWDH